MKTAIRSCPIKVHIPPYKWFMGLSAFFVFLMLTLLVCLQESHGGGPLAFDAAVCPWIYNLRTPELTSFFQVITRLGNWHTIVGVCLFCAVIPPLRPFLGYPCSCASLFSFGCYSGLKRLICRPRPDLSLRLIPQGGWSFPSGHAMTAGFCYGILAMQLFRHLRSRGYRIIAFFPAAILILLAFLIGFSRIYLGVHYPSDVLAGWSFSLFCITAYSCFSLQK